MPTNNSKPPFQFHFLLRKDSLKDRNRLKIFLANLFRKEKTAIESITYIFCSDKYLLHINQRFLQHDYYTDIITFNLSSENEKKVTGEIYISLDRVKENAILLSLPFYKELHRVIFHGALHLCGYKDKTKQQQAQMRGKEDFYLKSYFK
jgi:probable rRNA maturation factor